MRPCSSGRPSRSPASSPRWRWLRPEPSRPRSRGAVALAVVFSAADAGPPALVGAHDRHPAAQRSDASTGPWSTRWAPTPATTSACSRTPRRRHTACPGLRRRVVLTEGTLAALPPDELAAVMAHERAHLRARHDLVLEFFTVLHRAVPARLRAPAALREVHLLIEVLADRAARRRRRSRAARSRPGRARRGQPSRHRARRDGGLRATTSARMRLLTEPAAPSVAARDDGGLRGRASSPPPWSCSSSPWVEWTP